MELSSSCAPWAALWTEAEKPLLSTIAKKFNVEFNIFAAGISHLPDEDVGYMNADIMGSDEEVSKVIAWLEENSVHVRKDQE